MEEKKHLFEQVPKHLFEQVPKRLFEQVPKRLFEYTQEKEEKEQSQSVILHVSRRDTEVKSFQKGIEEAGIQNEQKKRFQSAEVKEIAHPVMETKGSWKNFDLQLCEVIEKIFDSPDGELKKEFYYFKIFIGRQVFEAMVDVENIANFKWVRSASGGRAFIRRGQSKISFEEYVSLIIEGSNPTVKIVYNLNGWKKIAGKNTYVYSAGTIGNVFTNVSGNPKQVFEFDAEKVGKEEIFRQALGMLEICGDQRITLPLFLTTHAGALTTLFEEAGVPPKFTVCVIGVTNSRKTSLSLCMTKTVNRWQITRPAVNFNATEGGIEKAISLHSDAVLVIDDFMPASTKTKQRILDTKLEKVLRIYGDREGIERMTDFAKNPGAGYYPVRGMGVITGEHIRGVQSSMLRSLILEVDQNSVNDEKLSYFQKNYKILTTHIYDFLDYITNNYESIVEFIRQRVEQYRTQIIFEFPRYREMYAQLMTIGEIFISYGVHRSFLDDYESERLLAEWTTTLLEVIKKNAEELRQKDFTTVLKDVCISVAENGAEPLPIVERKDYGDAVFEDENLIYMRLDSYLKKLYMFMSIWGMEFPSLSKRFILDKLEEAELIETKNKAEGKRTFKLPGSKLNRQVFLYIKKSKLFEDN